MSEELRQHLARHPPPWGCTGRRPHRTRRRQRKHAMREYRIRQQARIAKWRSEWPT